MAATRDESNEEGGGGRKASGSAGGEGRKLRSFDFRCLCGKLGYELDLITFLGSHGLG